MVRLGALVLGTLAGLWLILGLLGSENLRAERRLSPQVQPTSQDAETPPAGTENAIPVTPASVVQAETQTPERVQRFPGPPLNPSPEHADAGAADPLPAGGPVLYITGSRVNVRAGPSTGDRVVTALDRGTAVRPLGPADGEWVNIGIPNGRAGYVSGQFLSATAP